VPGGQLGQLADVHLDQATPDYLSHPRIVDHA
jgi:hypothetical protein